MSVVCIACRGEADDVIGSMWFVDVVAGSVGRAFGYAVNGVLDAINTPARNIVASLLRRSIGKVSSGSPSLLSFVISIFSFYPNCFVFRLVLSFIHILFFPSHFSTSMS